MKYYVPTSSHGGMVQVAKFEDAYVKVSDHEAEVARLRAEVEVYRKDAERYRWLRTDSAISAIPRVWSSDESAYPVTPLHLEFLDEAIDTTMGASA